MKITRIETLHVREYGNILWVRIHTDTGLIGYGETYYTPETTACFLHEVSSKILLGEDPRDIERLWWRQYEMSHIYGNRGNELRAISAVDIALWDILGQSANLPIYRLLGGPTRDRLLLYNTCAGPQYARATPGERGYSHHMSSRPGTYEDLHAFLTDAGALAQDLLDEGIRAMKIWPLDAVAETRGGWSIDRDGLTTGLRPVQQIREAVGDAVEIFIEGHCLWSLPAAIRISKALEPYGVSWVEDLVRADDPHTLAELRRATNIPIIGSERLQSRWAYQDLLRADAVDIVMTDPSWTGGISEALKIAHLASARDLPIVFHDCTGPLAFWACIHLSFAVTNVPIQESVRAYYRGYYGDVVTTLPTIDNGVVTLPETPGLGAPLKEDLFTRPDAQVRTSGL